ncbi:pitrilysin family protein [Bdellovibrionota bacterium FG-2]
MRVIALLVCQTLLFFSTAQAALQEPEVEVLPNGLTVAWFTSPKLPIVDFIFLVKAGSKDDPVGKSGTAQLVAATLDQGAAGMSAQQIGRAIESLGATRSVSAEEDVFTASVHGLASDGRRLLDLLFKIAIQPDFPLPEVTREQARILDRWSHLKDYSDSLASLALGRLLTWGSPYQRGGFLSSTEFQNVNRGDLDAFHKTYFLPSNAILTVVGQVKREELRPLLLKEFGDSEKFPPSEVVRIPARGFFDPRLKSATTSAQGAFRRIVVVERPLLKQVQIRIGVRAPLIGDPEHYALVVGNALIGELFNSRLNGLIRDQLGLTYGVQSSFSYKKEFASFSIATSTRTDQVGLVLQKTVEVLRQLQEGQLTQEEVKVAKEFLLGGFPLSTSTLESVASHWLVGMVFDRGAGYLNEFSPRVKAVTRDQVVAALRKHLNLNNLVIVVAGPSSEIEKSLVVSGFKSLKRLTVKDLE